MPCVNLQIHEQFGPVIDVHIQVSTPRRMAMELAKIPLPKSVTSRLLIDTGAYCTCLDENVIKSLNLMPSGSTIIHTPSTNADSGHQCNQYDICLTIPHNDKNMVFNAIPVVESKFSHQGIDGLLGRDVLSKCVFIYNGHLKLFTLTF